MILASCTVTKAPPIHSECEMHLGHSSKGRTEVLQEERESLRVSYQQCSCHKVLKNDLHVSASFGPYFSGLLKQLISISISLVETIFNSKTEIRAIE